MRVIKCRECGHEIRDWKPDYDDICERCWRKAEAEKGQRIERNRGLNEVFGPIT